MRPHDPFFEIGLVLLLLITPPGLILAWLYDREKGGDTDASEDDPQDDQETPDDPEAAALSAAPDNPQDMSRESARLNKHEEKSA